MPAPKQSPAASRSGSYVPDDLRGTVRVVVRCSPELAARARRMAARHDRTLAEILESGVADYEARPRPLTPDEEDAAAQADARYDRMREE